VNAHYARDMEFSLGLALAGLLVGLAVGMTGVGGGSLMTPALISLFGVPPVTAVATDLAFAAATKGVGVVAHRRSGLVRWPVAVIMIVSSCGSALLTMYLQRWWAAPSRELEAVVRNALAVALTLTVLSLLFNEPLTRWRAGKAALTPATTLILTAIAGGLIGALVIISSIGAGAVGVTVLSLLYPQWQPREVAATDLAYAVPLTAVGAVLHGLAGNIDTGLLMALLVGSVPGILIGVYAGARLHARTARTLLAGCLAMAAAKLII
jgi:uncharacterized protein